MWVQVCTKLSILSIHPLFNTHLLLVLIFLDVLLERYGWVERGGRIAEDDYST